MRQACNKCGNSIRRNGGVFCGSCKRAVIQERLEVGSIGREIAARRSKHLMEMVSDARPVEVKAEESNPTPKHDVAVLAAAAASQLAQAWGVRVKQRMEN